MWIGFCDIKHSLREILMEHAPALFDIEENPEMQEPQFERQRISEGLGFGEGSISGHAEPDVLSRAEDAIRSQQILVPVSRDDQGRIIEDDGCGDGRGVGLVFRLKERFKRSLNRAKVFGEAVAMAAAGLIGTGRATGRSVGETFVESVDTLEEQEMEFGAHTDELASGENSGCGAIDNAPKIVRAAVKYKEQICGVIEALGADTSELDHVYSNFENYVDELPSDEEYSGRHVMGKIIKAGKFIKQLAGKHHEKYIILNAVRGYTVNQELVRKQTHGRAQVFAVDIWRLEDIVTGLHPEDPSAESQTYLSGLIYTLATSAVLTKGDLPVYVIR
jgi:hypothetical protein